jgi:ATP-dependent Clp protease adaptor protein ClpS
MQANEIRYGTATETQSSTQNKTAPPWTVIVYDDPINLMQYVTMVFKKVFGYSEEKATILMKQVHEKGRSLVWSGEKEKAEFYVQQLHSFQLTASLEQES